jgi:hypothetical protein
MAAKDQVDRTTWALRSIDMSKFPFDGHLDPGTDTSINMAVYETRDTIGWGLMHDPSLFETATIDSISSAFANVLNLVARDPGAPLSHLPIPGLT